MYILNSEGDQIDVNIFWYSALWWELRKQVCYIFSCCQIFYIIVDHRRRFFAFWVLAFHFQSFCFVYEWCSTRITVVLHTFQSIHWSFLEGPSSSFPVEVVQWQESLAVYCKKFKCSQSELKFFFGHVVRKTHSCPSRFYTTITLLYNINVIFHHKIYI